MSNLRRKQDSISKKQQKRAANALTRTGEASAQQARKVESHSSKAAWLTFGSAALGAAALYHYNLSQRE